MIKSAILATLLLAAVLQFVGAGSALAGSGIEPVDLYILGDDTTESLAFAHVDHPLQPTLLHFTGVAFSEVGPTTMYVRFDWFDPAPHFVMLGEFDLPGTTADDQLVVVPVDVQFTIPFSPAAVGLSIEGTGCCDQFRVQGDFQHVVVPEPSALGLAALGAVGLLIATRRKREFAWEKR